MCICMAQLHCCVLETIKTLLISYIPISNKKLKKTESFADFGNNDQSYVWVYKSYKGSIISH